jgi:IclR helix-turn-helix domain
VSRALRILTLLEQADGEPIPFAGIARGIKAAKSSTSNLCQVLEDGRMIACTAIGSVLGRRRVELREFSDRCTSSPLFGQEVVHFAMVDVPPQCADPRRPLREVRLPRPHGYAIDQRGSPRRRVRGGGPTSPASCDRSLAIGGSLMCHG